VRESSQGRLAGARGADDCDDFSGKNREVHVLEKRDRADLSIQMANRQCRERSTSEHGELLFRLVEGQGVRTHAKLVRREQGSGAGGGTIEHRGASASKINDAPPLGRSAQLGVAIRHLGVWQGNVARGGTTDGVAILDEIEAEITGGVADIVLAKQSPNQHLVDTELVGCSGETTDLLSVDDAIDPADGEQRIEEEKSLGGTVAIGEGLEVELLGDRGP
jgi:hypothetical protein